MFKFTAIEESNEYLGFEEGEECYSINIEYVQEIIILPPITRIPNSPRYVEGAINLRGKVINVINLRRRLDLPWRPFDVNTRVLILNHEDTSLGMIVDRVLEVFKIEKNQKVDIPKLLRSEEGIAYANNVIKNELGLFINLDFPNLGGD